MILAEDRTPEGDLSMLGDTDVQGIYLSTDWEEDFMKASAIVILYLENEDFYCRVLRVWEMDLPRERVGTVLVKELERSEQF